MAAAIIDADLVRRLAFVELAHDGLESLVLAVVDELIGIPLLDVVAGDLVIGLAVLLPRAEIFAVAFPETPGQCELAGGEQAQVAEHLIVAVVLRRDAEGRGLDAQIDVLRYQYYRAVR